MTDQRDRNIDVPFNVDSPKTRSTFNSALATQPVHPRMRTGQNFTLLFHRMDEGWGERPPWTSRAQGDSEPTPTTPRRGALSGPLLGGVGVGRFMEREEVAAVRLSSFGDAPPANFCERHTVQLMTHARCCSMLLTNRYADFSGRAVPRSWVFGQRQKDIQPSGNKLLRPQWQAWP